MVLVTGKEVAAAVLIALAVGAAIAVLVYSVQILVALVHFFTFILYVLAEAPYV